MACPDDHPEDKYGKENCRAWDEKHKRIWATWHYTMIVEERCMWADPPPIMALVRKPSYFRTLAQFTRLKLGRLSMGFRILCWMYMAALKDVVEAAIYKYLLKVLSQDRHDDRDSGHFWE